MRSEFVSEGMRPKRKEAVPAPAPAPLTLEQRWEQLVEHTQIGHLEELYRRVQQIGANQRLEHRSHGEYRASVCWTASSGLMMTWDVGERPRMFQKLEEEVI